MQQSRQTSKTISYVVDELSKNFTLSSLDIDSKVNNLNNTELNILLISIFGEEELNNNWLSFFSKKEVCFLGKNIIVFLFGVYDDFINENSVIVKQVKYFLSSCCNDLNFYPRKLSRYSLDLNLVKDYISSYRVADQLKIDYQKIIKYLEYKNQCLVLSNDVTSLDLTSSYDGFTNMLDVLCFDERKRVLKSLLNLSYHEKFTCNRLNLEDFYFNDISSNTIKRMYFKSCSIDDVPYLNQLSHLEVLNLSANLIEILDFRKLPKSLKRLNFSKNRIINFEGKENCYTHLESIALFNNKISDFSWLSCVQNVKYLNIGMNPITEFPLEILQLKYLEYLNLALTAIKDIPQDILKMENLKVLDIKHCDDMKIEAPVFQKLKNQGVEIIC